VSDERVRSNEFGSVEVLVDGSWVPYVPGMFLARDGQMRAWVVGSGEEWRRVTERRWRLSSSYVVAFACLVIGLIGGLLLAPFFWPANEQMCGAGLHRDTPPRSGVTALAPGLTGGGR
jgi:hypothetical protein